MDNSSEMQHSTPKKFLPMEKTFQPVTESMLKSSGEQPSTKENCSPHILIFIKKGNRSYRSTCFSLWQQHNSKEGLHNK